MHGDGSIFETHNNGKLVWAYRWRADGKSHTKIFPHTADGKKMAESFKKQKRIELQVGIKGTPLSLKDSIISYLRTYKLGKVRDSSYRRNLDTLYAIPQALRDMRIDTITKDNIQNALNDGNLSDNTKRKIYDLINATCKNAVANKKLWDNPCETLQRPQMKKSEKEIFTEQEIFRLFRTIRFIQTSGTYHSIKHDYYTIFLLLLTTGLRIGEALALRWEDIDWTEGHEEIHIQRTLDSHYINTTEKKGQQRFNDPKTAQGNRFIPLFSKHLIARLKAMRPSEEATGQVFATKNGTALTYHNFAKTWAAIGREYARRCPVCGHKRPNDWTCSKGHHVTRRALICKQCGEERPTTWTCPECNKLVSEIHKSPHSTRHTFVSYLLNHSVPIKYVQSLAGHADSTVTVDTYGHAPKHLRDGVTESFRK